MAIQHTLYISSTRIKKDTALGGSVDDNIIMPYILLAQDMFILPVLGTDLDAKLKAEIQAGSLSGAYKTLVETYIQPALVQASFSELAPKDAAEFYRERLIDYIRNNTSSFPEYSTNSGADLDPTVNNYFAGINLDVNVPRSNRLRGFLQGADITIYGC